MTTTDDTQPRSPFKDRQPVQQPQSQPPQQSTFMPPPTQPREERRGPGCLVWGILTATILSFGLLIVVLAATAGWTSGQRVADSNSTATVVGKIAEQMALVGTDVANGNQYVVSQRLNFLATLTPGVGGVAELRSTATALYLTAQPTVTPTQTATIAPTQTPESTVTAESTESTAGNNATSSPYDLNALLAEAQDQVDLGQFEDAVDTLDAIIRIDAEFQRPLVRALISQALNTLATQLYRSEDTLAEAIRLTDLVEQYGGTLAEGLSYERLIATLYLDAIRAVGTGNHLAAINALNELRTYQTTYQGANINELLFNEYADYGRAFAIQGDQCSATGQFNIALTIFANGEIQAARDTAQTLCEQGTPTPDPLVPPTPGS